MNDIKPVDQSNTVQIVYRDFCKSIWQGLDILVDEMDRHALNGHPVSWLCSFLLLSFFF